jgi:hypothetical protein
LLQHRRPSHLESQQQRSFGTLQVLAVAMLVLNYDVRSLLQGWPMLNVEEDDRKRLLQSVTDVVLVNGTSRVPDDKDISLAKELIRSRWRFLMPIP